MVAVSFFFNEIKNKVYSINIAKIQKRSIHLLRREIFFCPCRILLNVSGSYRGHRGIESLLCNFSFLPLPQIDWHSLDIGLLDIRQIGRNVSIIKKKL